jgi:Zn-dependent peptidase ImmA (M78 family)
MGYCYTLSIGYSVTINSNGDKVARSSTVWHNFEHYVCDKQGNYPRDAEAELSAFNATLDLSKTELLFKTESDRTFFLLRFS